MIKFEKFNSDIKNQINKIAEEVFEFEMPVSPKYANTYDYILDDNNKILAAIKPSESYGVKTVSIVRFDLSLTEPKNIVPLKEILNDYMNTHHANILTCQETGVGMEIGMVMCNMQSSVQKDVEYFDMFHENACAKNKNYADDIRDAIEKQCFIKDISGYKIKKIDKKKDIVGIYHPTQYDDYNHCSYVGFHYFSPNDYFEEGRNYYVVAMKDDKVLGVAMLGEYVEGQSLAYIDVATPYKCKGIATNMIKAMNEYIDPNRPLHISSLSDEGRRCNIDEILKKNITATNIVLSELDRYRNGTVIDMLER